MSRPAKLAHFSPEEYLAWEIQHEQKHEYVRGEVFAMVGATRKHVTVGMNLSAHCLSHLRGGPCRVYMSDMKLRIEAADAFFYPDLMVTCAPQDHVAETHLDAPILIMEILSPSTEAFDRGEKFAAYRLIPSLREYVLVDPDTQRIEIYRRDDTNRWYLIEPDESGEFELSSIRLQVSSALVFENVRD
jgi:Uma2 family endonuclease